MINYSKGANVTLLNTIYIQPIRDEKGKYTKPVLILVYKDNDTGIKHKTEIVNPDYTYYMIKDEYALDYNPLFIEEYKVDKITVPFVDLEKDIAERTDNLEFFYDNIRNGNRNANRQLHQHVRLIGSDTDIEDHYRQRFSELYKNDIIPITKCFLDIELDNRGSNFNGHIEFGKFPINAVTVCMEHINKTFTFLLRNEDNPVAQEFERNLSPETFVELKEFIRKQVGGEEGEIKYGLKDMEYQMLFYDDEVTLITDIFRCINTYQPDFVLAWNMAFDIPYIMSRLLVLGVDPISVVCHPDFENKIAYYYTDERNGNLFANRGDYARISSYSVFLDQMIHFASRRKGGKAISSFSLDNIGEMTVGIKKLDYKHITQDLSELPYIDYKTFVFYNIMDTIVQKCIEKKTGDIDYIFSKALINNTRYSKVHRQTIYLANRGRKEFKNGKDNLILGNNVNIFGKENDSTIPGAFVGDPKLVSDYAKVRINGVPVNIYNNCDDFDYKSLYPSIEREFNMGPNTIIGYINVDSAINMTPSTFKESANASGGGRFLEDFQSNQWLELCTRWFNLADYGQLIEDFEEYFTVYANPSRPLRLYDYNGVMKGLIFENKNVPVPGIVLIDGVEPGIDYYIKREV